MGIGLTPASTTKKSDDMMEISIIDSPHNNAQRFRNRVYKHVLNHRDLFGYSKGCNILPYMFCSNDLSKTFLELMRMTSEHKDSEDIQDITLDLTNILKLLIRSYDDVDSGQCTNGCCGYWHSVKKEVFVELRKTIKEQLHSSLHA